MTDVAQERKVMVLGAHCEECGVEGIGAWIGNDLAPDAPRIASCLRPRGVRRQEFPVIVPLETVMERQTCGLCGGQWVFDLAGVRE